MHEFIEITIDETFANFKDGQDVVAEFANGNKLLMNNSYESFIKFSNLENIKWLKVKE